MEKKETRQNQQPLPSRLLPLQNLRQDVKFCSLAELKNCLDSAQVNSLQKESKNSILKLLESDIRPSEVDSKCLSLWKNSDKRPPIAPWQACSIKSKGKIGKGTLIPGSSVKSVESVGPPQLAADNGQIISDIPLKPAAIAAIKSMATAGKRQDQKIAKNLVADKSVILAEKKHCISFEISTATSFTSQDSEDYAESTGLSELDDYRSTSELDNNDEFDELSDIDGDDSAVISQCNSSLSWTSLDNKQDEVSESVTTTDSGLGSDADISTHLPITSSLFKYCPPVLYFPTEHEKVSKLPRALQKQMKWKMSTITPNVVKNIIARSGFVPSTKRREWIGYWGKHMKAAAFRNILPNQKVNHFPGTFEIGRKDKLWKNLNKAQIKHSKKEYDFIPLTFCLPSEWKTFKRYWDESGHKQKWIIKPPASARGIGIKVIHKLNQIPRKRSIIIQRYLASPYLINGRKFDLRIYVYVSSYDPLTIYMYDNGLVRFASSKYSHSSKSLSNRYVHLTNYSVNKYNDQYIKNEDEAGTESHKWALKALWKYLQVAGVDVDSIKAKIKDIVIKTIIASVPTVTSLSKSHCKYRHTCHELFGFDIFLDHHLKPWLIEVNISPSLHTSAPLDKQIKYGLVRDLFNTAGFLVPQQPSRSKSSVQSRAGGTPVVSSRSSVVASASTRSSVPGSTRSSVAAPGAGAVIAGGRLEWNGEGGDSVSDKQLYFNPGLQLTSDERAKHAFFTQKYPTDASTVESILDTLTPDDIRVIMKFEDESSRRGDLNLIFPSETGSKYLKYFAMPKFYDLLILQWIKKYQKDRHRGVVRLQKLAETQVQFARTPTNPENIWCKQTLRNLKRFDKVSEKKTGRKSLSVRSGPSSLAGSNVNLSPSSIEVFLQPIKKGVRPITYKPPLPLPAARPSAQSLNLARSQPGLAQVTRSSVASSSKSRALNVRSQSRQPGVNKVSSPSQSSTIMSPAGSNKSKPLGSRTSLDRDSVKVQLRKPSDQKTAAKLAR